MRAPDPGRRADRGAHPAGQPSTRRA
jgi:hypothetical protein